MYKPILEIEGNGEKFSIIFTLNSNHPNLTAAQWKKIQRAIGRIVGWINGIL